MLTAKQEKFLQEIYMHSNASEAYRSTYSNKMRSKTVWEAASRLSKNPKVVARLEEIRVEKEAEKRMLRLSYGDLVINELQSMALNSRSGRVRIKALELLGKTVGLFNLYRGHL